MEKTIRLERELAYTGTILKVYRDTVVANGIQETYDYIHHDGAAAVLPVTKDGKLLRCASTGTHWTGLLWSCQLERWMRRTSPGSNVRTGSWRRRPGSKRRPWNIL